LPAFCLSAAPGAAGISERAAGEEDDRVAVLDGDRQVAAGVARRRHEMDVARLSEAPRLKYGCQGAK
jgi:hypothetical protein